MLPTSLYIHIPWCIRKCPYCDFNSHKSPENLPEEAYIQALIKDLEADLAQFEQRDIESIFIGGGTPSLFSASAYKILFEKLKKHLNFKEDIEISLEANPGTVEQDRFKAYRELGINRLSLGVQSFSQEKLQILGRIHDEKQAHNAIETARLAGFTNINIDIMHSLPKQSIEEGLKDLELALSYQPEHLSWYQLTLEPNTVFYKSKPSLPSEDSCYELETAGLNFLAKNCMQRYEISAFSKPGYSCVHNLNYWLFGDYYGIGAGAHGKLTTSKQIIRTTKTRQPKDYLNAEKFPSLPTTQLSQADIIFEFMLNSTRLEQKISNQTFELRTGLTFSDLEPKLKIAEAKGLLNIYQDYWQLTSLGRRFTNNLQLIFLP